MIWPFVKRKSGPTQNQEWHLSDPLISFNNADLLTIGDLYEGVSIIGGVGSGKTSGSGFMLAKAMLAAGFSGYVMTAKIDECERWRKLCKLTRRQQDLVVIDESTKHRFNFLDYLINRSESDIGLSEHVVNQLMDLSELLGRMSGSGQSRSDEEFWRNSARILARNAIELVYMATGTLSIPFIIEVIQDAPTSRLDAMSDHWRQNSTTYLALQKARERVSKNQRRDLDSVERYFTADWPNLADKTRSVVFAMVMGVIDIFGRGLLYRLLGQDSTVTPDDVLNGKIVVWDLPIKKYFAMGLLAQTIFKNCLQQRLEQRAADEIRPCFIYIDEAQNFLQQKDMHFMATARSSRCASIWLTQNISNVLYALGGSEVGKAASDSLLGLCQTKVFHANPDTVTNEWAAELIGRRLQRMRSMSYTLPQRQMTDWFDPAPVVNSGFNETYEFAVQPHEFSMLRKGGAANKMECDAIVYQGGRIWNSTGETYLKTRIKQGF